MYDHHRATIANLVQRFSADDDVAALIVVGSVARDDARPESDVDFLLVPADERGEAALNLVDASTCCVAPCTEANGQYFAKTRLLQVEANGNDVARYAFTRAAVMFTRDADVPAIVSRITCCPEADRQARLETFHSQMYLHFSFFEFAVRSQTKYLIYETATKMILAIGRLVLADNRLLYPGRKWFFRELQRAPDQPRGLCAAMLDVLDRPTLDAGRDLLALVDAHKPYPLPAEGWRARIARDGDLNLEAR